MSCTIFSAASKAVFVGILLLAVECLGFLLAKWSMQSFLLPPVTALGRWLAAGLFAVLGKANPLLEDALLFAEQAALICCSAAAKFCKLVPKSFCRIGVGPAGACLLWTDFLKSL